MATVAHELSMETRARIDVRAGVILDSLLRAIVVEFPNTALNASVYASLLMQSRQLAIQEEILAALQKEE